MITFNKVYIWLSKITHLSLHSLPFLINLKNIKISFNNLNEKLRFPEKNFQIFDPIESYFECITSCDIRDGRCISRCVEILKHNDG